MLANSCSSIVRRYPLSLIVALLIAICSLIPLSLPESITDVPFYDKWGHFLMYGVLSIVAWMEYIRPYRRSGHKLSRSLPSYPWLEALFVGVLLPSLWGGLMEVLQSVCTTNRSGDWMDFLADIVGVAIGTIVAVAEALIHNARS